MKKRILHIILIIAVGCISIPTFSQDVHFSQYNAQPLLLNPAFSGLNKCDYRFGANFRTQWTGVSAGNTYRTVSAFGDVAIGKPTPYSNFGGIGLSFYSDQAGDLNYNTNKVDLSLAYHFIIDGSSMQSISAGIYGGFGHRSINQANAIYNDQIDPITGVDVTTGGEQIDNNRLFYGDAGLGFLWSYGNRDGLSLHLGTGLAHINQPNLSLFTPKDEIEKLYLKFTLHGGSEIPVTEQISLMPGFLMLKQGPSLEFTLSNYVKYKFNSLPHKKEAIYLGTMYRVKDALILAVRADFKGFNVGFSYDVNISKLTPASNANGGPEISLQYTGCISRKQSTRYCPSY